MKKNILFCWVGSTDLRASRGEEDGLGPIGQSLRDREFDRVCLLSNFPQTESRAFRAWAQQHTAADVTLRSAKLSSPMNYGEIYEAAEAAIANQSTASSDLLTYHISPGTSAMAAVWIILAKTKHPAELIASTKEGGAYTVELPFDISADYLPVQRRAASRLLQEEFLDRTPPAFENIIHRCDAMKKVISKAQRVAQFDVPVLIQGESGTGKELFAEAIHNASPRSDQPLETVNCGAIPESLVEAELFGSVKGAFTDARDRAGYFERADGGTLFLDEVGDLPLSAQVKLLRVLQAGQINRVGSDQVKSVDVRIIAATHRNVADEVADGRFREDLFHRIAVGILHLPPLRERPGDVRLLADLRLEQFNAKFSSVLSGAPRKLSAGARNLLNQHPWPGNIRELFNTISRACIWSDGPAISTADLQDALVKVSSQKSGECLILNRPLIDGFSLEDVIGEVARHYLKRALSETRTKVAAAQLVGFDSAKRLTDWLKKYELDDAPDSLQPKQKK